jgi:hypothetical protein
VAAANVPSGLALPTAMVNWPARSWLTVDVACVYTVVEPEVVTRMWKPPEVSRVKLPVLTSVTFPSALPPGAGERRGP